MSIVGVCRFRFERLLLYRDFDRETKVKAYGRMGRMHPDYLGLLRLGIGVNHLDVTHIVRLRELLRFG